MITKRRLGRGGPEITTVGFGAWAVGGPWRVGWGPQDDADSISAIRRALDLGVNWIDTAAIYGLGHSEEVVGAALDGVPRDQVVVATKCGRTPDATGQPHADLRPVRIREEIELSLRRLRTDYVDLFQIHWPDNETGTPVEDSWATLVALKEEGKVRWIGVSNFDVELLERCRAVHPVQSLQPPYNLVRREVEAEILPYCLEHGIGVVAYAPMQSGLLTGSFSIDRLAEDDWRRRHPFFQEPALTRHLGAVEAVRPIAERQGGTVGQLAVAWTLTHPAVTAAIVGARSPAQVEQNVEVERMELSPEDVEALELAFEAEGPGGS